MSKRFLQLFSDPAPALRVKFRTSDEEAKIIRVRHRLGPKGNAEGHDYLASLGGDANLREFREFYQNYDGAELCRTYDARFGSEKPLIEMKPAKGIARFTSRYMPGGDLAWTMELNKSRALYRSSASWIAFVEINSGPACLTMFLDGENVGCVYYVTPQPEFNILRPIAAGFQSLLERIGEDLPAFLGLVRATVSLRGTDGENYGFLPVDYLASANECRRESSEGS